MAGDTSRRDILKALGAIPLVARGRRRASSPAAVSLGIHAPLVVTSQNLQWAPDRGGCGRSCRSWI